jgi:DNA-binding transcriptional LysR family regulator
MDLKQLNTFLTLAKLKSFTKTADKLGYAQSTITTQMQLLEGELDVKLFERFGRNIILTAAGENLLPYANQIMNLSTDAKNSLDNTNTPKGSIIIGAVESLCISLLPDLMKKYQESYPEVKLVLKLGNCKMFRDQLRKNLIDIAFFLDQKIVSSDLILDAQFQEPIVFAASPSYGLAGKELQAEDLKKFKFILTEEGCPYRNMLENYFNHYNVFPESTLEIESIQTIKRLAVNGTGITLLPKIAIEDELENHLLTILNIKDYDFHVYTQVIHHKDKWVSAPLKAFIELIKERQ